MPRPSLKEERRAEILDAYGRCVARYGVDGASLEKTAEEAGLARALIRHNVGNKAELLDAFLDQFQSKSSEVSDQLFESLPQENRVATMLQWLFDPHYADPQDIRINNALLTAAIERPTLARRLRKWTTEFVDRLARELAAEHPDIKRARIDTVAAGVAAIYLSFDAMAPLGEATQIRKSSQTAAELLVTTLNNEQNP